MNGDPSIWDNPRTLLGAKVATALEDLRYLTAVQILGTDVPDVYLPSSYGPPGTPSEAESSGKEAQCASEDQAREVADSFRRVA